MWNIGGWGNKRHQIEVIELAPPGVQTGLTPGQHLLRARAVDLAGGAADFVGREDDRIRAAVAGAPTAAGAGSTRPSAQRPATSSG